MKFKINGNEASRRCYSSTIDKIVGHLNKMKDGELADYYELCRQIGYSPLTVNVIRSASRLPAGFRTKEKNTTRFLYGNPKTIKAYQQVQD